MQTYDLTPLFRTTVGFDRMARLMEAAMTSDRPARAYPPYNIVKVDDDHYRVSLAVAGFSEEDLNLQTHEGRLTISATSREDGTDLEYLHRGIAGRSFERVFQLADHIRVVGARLEHGLLHVELHREVPEALKPRSIPIATAAPALQGEVAAK